MNEDNSIVWKPRRFRPAGCGEFLGYCPRCKSPKWLIAQAQREVGGPDDPEDVKPRLVIHLADGYEPQQVGLETAWVWSKPPPMLLPHRRLAVKWARQGPDMEAALLFQETERQAAKRGLRAGPPPPARPEGFTRPEPIFAVPVEPGALVFCRNPEYRPAADRRLHGAGVIRVPCCCPIRISTPFDSSETLC